MDEKSKTIIQCDTCSHQFFIDETTIEWGKTDRFEVQFFRCPKCKTIYPIMIYDAPQKKLLKHIMAIQNEIEIRHNRHKVVSPAKLRQLKRLIDEAKDHQTILRDTYSQAVTDQLNKSDNETNSITGKEEMS